MMEFINMLIEGIMDSVEEFFASLNAPSTKFTMNAFVYSLVFLAGSIVLQICDIPCFVSWQEALTCSILLLIIVCIDTGVRGNIKAGLGKFKTIASNFSYTGEEELEASEDNMEVSEDGSEY